MERQHFAYAAYALIAVLAIATLDGKLLAAVLVLLVGLALKTYLAVRQSKL